MYSTMRTFPKIINGKILFYSEVVNYDRDGSRVGEPILLEPIYSMGWSDGSDVTQDEVEKLNHDR